MRTDIGTYSPVISPLEIIEPDNGIFHCNWALDI